MGRVEDNVRRFSVEFIPSLYPRVFYYIQYALVNCMKIIQRQCFRNYEPRQRGVEFLVIPPERDRPVVYFKFLRIKLWLAAADGSRSRRIFPLPLSMPLPEDYR